jgi:biopolymer transport protein ExbB
MFFNFIAAGFKDPGGSWAMWLILMIGVALVGLVIERGIYLFSAAGNSAAFMGGISKFLKTGDFDKAQKYAASKEKMPLAIAVVEILKNRGNGTKAVQKAVDEVFLTEVPKITKSIPLINIMANISTMVGLMGTIFGLMMAFDAVANAPAAQRATELAKGISVAMSTTLFGLVVAVPGVLLQGILSAKSTKVVDDMDEKTSKLINLIQQ